MKGLFNEEPTVELHRKPDYKDQTAVSYQTVNTLGANKVINNLNIYRSPLLNAATELLGILVSIPRQGEPRDIGLFRQYLLDGIMAFRQRGILLDYHPSVIEKSSFILCSALDEAILYTTWGEAVRWENQSLLSRVFSQRNGGEAFFILLKNALQQPVKLMDFLELQYILLMLGFKGRYRNEDERVLYEIKSEIYAKIISNHIELPLPDTTSLVVGMRPWRMLSVKKMLLCTMVIIISGYLASEYWYYNDSQYLLQEIKTVGVSMPGIETSSLNVSFDNSTPHVLAVKNKSQLLASKWDMPLVGVDNSENPLRLISGLQHQKYDAVTHKTSYDTDLFVRSDDYLTVALNLEKKINAYYGVNSEAIKTRAEYDEK